MRSEIFVVLLLAGCQASFAIKEVEEEPRYNPATVINVMATVTDIREVPRGNPLTGIHLAVKVESEALEIYLGPADFVKQFEITFARGNEIQVIGSKIKFGAAHIVLAREVRKEEITLYCRDKKGEPNWKIDGGLTAR
jgi:hypothetical protein